MEFPFDNKPCRKMNEADKERYFREKEAYERITGQVFPVSKVLKRSLSTLVFFFYLRSLVFFFYLRSLCPPTHQMLCKMLQVPPGESLAHNMPDMRKQTWECSKVHQSWLRSAKYQEHRVGGRVLQVIKKSTAGDILGNLLSIALLLGVEQNKKLVHFKNSRYFSP